MANAPRGNQARYTPEMKGLGLLDCHACGGLLRDHAVGARCPQLGDLRITVGKPAWGRGDSSSEDAKKQRERRARAKARREGNPGTSPGNPPKGEPPSGDSGSS